MITKSKWKEKMSRLNTLSYRALSGMITPEEQKEAEKLSRELDPGGWAYLDNLQSVDGKG